MIELSWQLMMGVGLAASAGLRAFLPLLAVGVAGRIGLVPLSEPMSWLQSTPALIVLMVAVVVEILGDKVPAVDHVLDLLGTWVRPIAGAIAAAAPLAALSPMLAAGVGIVLGGTVAGGVHGAKASMRLVSSGATAGIGNPLLSLIEDGISVAGCVVSLFVPVVTFTVAIGGLYLAARRGQRPRSDGRRTRGAAGS